MDGAPWVGGPAVVLAYPAAGVRGTWIDRLAVAPGPPLAVVGPLFVVATAGVVAGGDGGSSALAVATTWSRTS